MTRLTACDAPPEVANHCCEPSDYQKAAGNGIHDKWSSLIVRNGAPCRAKIEEYVFRLQIAMNDPISVHAFNAMADLLADSVAHLQGKGFLVVRSIPEQHLVQVALCAIVLQAQERTATARQEQAAQINMEPKVNVQ